MQGTTSKGNHATTITYYYKKGNEIVKQITSYYFWNTEGLKAYITG